MIDSFTPSPALAPYVEGYWHFDLSSPGQSMTVLPGPYSFACFLFGDPVHARYKGGELLAMSNAHGLQTAPVTMTLPERLSAVVVRFHAWGLRHFLHEAPGTLTDQRLDSRALFAPRAIAALEDELAHLPDAAARVRRVEHFLLEQQQPAEPDRVVLQLSRHIYGNGGQDSVAALAHQAGLSERQLARRFQTQLGMAPKTFSRLVRFQHVLSRQQQGLPWAGLASEAGYADQAHLVREIQAFCGLSPAALRQSGNPQAAHFNAATVSDFFNTWFL